MSRMIQISELTFAGRDRRRILENLNLSVERGEVLTLIGPTNSGKTLLLELLQGIAKPLSGQILVSDRNVTRLSPAKLQQLRQQLGVVPQHLICPAQLNLEEAQLDRLYLEARQWQEVASLRLVLEAQDLGLPASVALPPNAPAILLNLGSDANSQQVVDRAQMLGGVQQAVPLAAVEDPAAQQQVQVIKPLLLSVFVVLTLASFIALHGGVRRLLRQWKGELELLRLSGVSPRDVASSFAAVALLFSAVGAAVAAAGIYLGLPWAQGVEGLRPYLPDSFEPQRLLGLALGTLIAGLLVGVLASAWGTRAQGRRL